MGASKRAPQAPDARTRPWSAVARLDNPRDWVAQMAREPPTLGSFGARPTPRAPARVPHRDARVALQDAHGAASAAGTENCRRAGTGARSRPRRPSPAPRAGPPV